jgi:LPS-assembly protein
MAPTFLTSARNIAPITSRIRFEAIDNLRIQWDLAYDTIAGQLAADNIFAGYSFGRTTLGIGHALLNAVDDQVTNGATSSTPAAFSMLKSQQVQPFLEIGKPSGNGLNLAVNGGYDFVLHEVQYGGVQAVYNWNCSGLTLGYRRDPVALQLHPGQLRRRGRHPPVQLRVPRCHAAAGVLETGNRE